MTFFQKKTNIRIKIEKVIILEIEEAHLFHNILKGFKCSVLKYPFKTMYGYLFPCCNCKHTPSRSGKDYSCSNRVCNLMLNPMLEWAILFLKDLLSLEKVLVVLMFLKTGSKDYSQDKFYVLYTYYYQKFRAIESCHNGTICIEMHVYQTGERVAVGVVRGWILVQHKIRHLGALSIHCYLGNITTHS